VSRRPASVSRLARAAGLDLDETLVALWDAGIDYVLNPSGMVLGRDIATAQRALGVPSSREQTTVEYWRAISGLSREELADRLAEVGVTLSPQVRRVPKNSLRKLRRMFGEARGTPPIDDTPEPAPPLRWEVIGSQ